MPKYYNEDHLVDQFGRIVPYDTLKGTFPPGVSNEMKRGVGLTNVRKRLDLLYGQDYTLRIHDDAEIYTVELNIPL